MRPILALAFLVLGADFFEPLKSTHEKIAGGVTPKYWLSLLIYPILIYLLVFVPMKRMRGNGSPTARAD